MFISDARRVRRLIDNCEYNTSKNEFKITFKDDGVALLAGMIIGKDGKKYGKSVWFSPPKGISADDIITMLDIATDIKTS
jgi:hypothetical protein